MTEHPILFSDPMVRALLAGTKSQTRRAVKGPALEWLNAPVGFSPEYAAAPENHLSPYGYAGDRLWVKEAFFAFGRWKTRFSEKKGRDEWHFVDMTWGDGRQHLFKDPQPLATRLRADTLPQWWPRNSLFMPRLVSRIDLEVTGVSIERLQDISEADALAEGIVAIGGGFGLADGSHFHSSDPRVSYFSLFEAINGPGSVETNPWLWVVKFARK